MPETCGAEHPSMSGVHCEKPKPCSLIHTSLSADLDWQGEPPQSQKSRKAEAAGMAQNIPPAPTTGPPVPTRTVPLVTGDGIPSDYVGSLKPDEWVEHATKVFHEFLLDHSTSFTMAQDVWPLLDAPEEMRTMVHPVRRALRDGWIVEVAAKRLQGKFKTKDGQVFRQNKLVPVYVSQIAVIS